MPARVLDGARSRIRERSSGDFRRKAAEYVPARAADGMSTGMKAALVVVPVLLLAGGGYMATRPSSQSPPVPPPSKVVEVAPEKPAGNTRATTTVATPEPKEPVAPAGPKKMKVSFRSTPSGAGIFRDGMQIGTAPTNLLLNRDEVHSLTFRLAEHKDVERLSSAADEAQSVDVTLEPVRKAQPTPRPRLRQKPPGDPDSSVFESLRLDFRHFRAGRAGHAACAASR